MIKKNLRIRITRWDLIEAGECLAWFFSLPVFILAGTASFFLRRFPMRKKQARIGVFMFAGFGDHMFVLPMMAELKKKYPDSSIQVITNAGRPHEWNKMVSGTISLRGRMLPVRQTRSLWFYRGLLFVRNLGLVLKLLTLRLDVSVSIGSGPTYANLGALLFYYGGVKRRLGSEYVEPPYARYLSSQPKILPCENVRASYLRILPWIKEETLRSVSHDYSGRLLMDVPGLEKVLSSKALNPKLPHVVIHPGGKQGINLRQWPADRYQELIARILDGFEVRVFVTGTADERGMIGGTGEASDARVVNLCGETTLQGLLALLKTSLLVVSNDTAVLHMSGAVHTKNVIGIFGPTTPSRVSPLSPGARIIQPDMACAPCIPLDAADARNQCSNSNRYACIYETPVDRVWSLVQEILSRELNEKPALADH